MCRTVFSQVYLGKCSEATATLVKGTRPCLELAAELDIIIYIVLVLQAFRMQASRKEVVAY